MNLIDKLSKIFGVFPGVGPRQAKRFVYFLLSDKRGVIAGLREALALIEKQISRCKFCGRYFNGETKTDVCAVCSDKSRDHSTLMVVAKDFDFEAIEKSGAYAGLYFILGGTIPILADKPEERVKGKELLQEIKRRLPEGLKEIILALNPNPEGENTAMYVEKLLEPLKYKEIKITVLGRGLSTGTELEYADPLTIKEALSGRKRER